MTKYLQHIIKQYFKYFKKLITLTYVMNWTKLQMNILRQRLQNTSTSVHVILFYKNRIVEIKLRVKSSCIVKNPSMNTPKSKILPRNRRLMTSRRRDRAAPFLPDLTMDKELDHSIIIFTFKRLFCLE